MESHFLQTCAAMEGISGLNANITKCEFYCFKRRITQTIKLPRKGPCKSFLCVSRTSNMRRDGSHVNFSVWMLLEGLRRRAHRWILTSRRCLTTQSVRWARSGLPSAVSHSRLRSASRGSASWLESGKARGRKNPKFFSVTHRNCQLFVVMRESASECLSCRCHSSVVQTSYGCFLLLSSFFFFF